MTDDEKKKRQWKQEQKKMDQRKVFLSNAHVKDDCSKIKVARGKRMLYSNISCLFQSRKFNPKNKQNKS